VATATTATATLKLPLGQNRVVLRVYDDKLATSMATATVTVVDTTPPALTSPGNVVVFVGEGSSAIVDLGFPGVADACDPRPAVRAVWLLDGETTVNQPIPDPKHATFPLGGHTVRWFVTDAGGNTATVDQFVDINAGSGVDVPPTLQAPPTCPDPPLTSSTPVPLDVRVCVFGRMNLTTNTREGTAAWASCSTDQCVIDNLNSVFADARALWSDTVALNVVGFKVIADPCPPGYTDSSCISSCGGPTTFLQNNYGDMCNFDAGSSAPPGYEYGQAVKWCQQAWQFQPRLGGTAFDQCQRGLVAVIGNKVVSGTFCAFGNHGSPREADPQGDNVPLFACDDPNKINNNDQGAYLTFPQTETSCFQHALAHELGHALGMHHGDGVDNDCNGVWDYTCDQPEFNAFDCMNGSFSLMCDLSDSTVLTNLQKNRVRVFASRTPTTNGAQTPGQNCGTVVPPPVPGDVGHVTVTVDTGGCGGGGGCLIGATAPIETSVLLLALGLLTLTLRRRR
jgi:hypothetical protein